MSSDVKRAFGPGSVEMASSVHDFEPPARPWHQSVRVALSFRNISAIYIFLVLFVLFSLWVPETFLQWDTWHSLLATQALVALVAIGLVPALAAGVFNLAIGAQVGFGSILVAWFLAKQGLGVAPAIALTVVAGTVIGVGSGLVITRFRIDSFIATLGISSVLLAMIQWIANSQQIVDLGESFQRIATNEVLGLTLPVWFMLAVGLLLWYVLERTPLGRRLYATGGNPEAARLAGVPVPAMIVLSLAICGAIATAAGILQSAQVGTGDPTVGPGFLLPAFAAAFLGSTQFRGGRYNIWGTVVAVYVLATGVKGLQLAGAPVWIPDLFNGIALLIAVGMSRIEATSIRSRAISRMIRRPGSGATTRAEENTSN
jgi:ribose transport system permease protein